MDPRPTPTQQTAHEANHPWREASRPVHERVALLMDQMTLEEKLAQLYGIWVGASTEGGEVAPFQFDAKQPMELNDLLPHGLGQLTRPFGSAPVDPAVGVLSLARTQEKIAASNRFGIPAIAHEECLSGFTAWGATAYPAPLSWGATFDPALIRRMAHRIGTSMRAVGIHQGLAPVLDVVRDARWGRVEESIGEDPYLVGMTATAYVQGLQEAGIIATLKHFVGYSGSKAGRNLAPVSIGSRELADVLLPPFEMALRDGQASSVMHSYTDVDGMPSAADEELLTGLLRNKLSFTGTVVADYFGVRFLQSLHGVAVDGADAAAQALMAGVDVELPSRDTFDESLVASIRSGHFREEFVDRALARVLTQKIDLGLLDDDWSPYPAGWTKDDSTNIEAARGTIDLDKDEDRALAKEIAERAVVLLTNNGILPLSAPPRIAVIGPCADDPMVLLGCYAFPNHVLSHHPDIPLGISIPTVAEAIRAEFPSAHVTVHEGVTIDGPEESGIAEAVRLAAESDVVIVALGDRAGLFGRGTSGEGCDASDLELPGVQWQLLDQLLTTGVPVVPVVISGRPYALHDAPDRAAALLQTFFPGEEGASAVAGVLSGRVVPSGRLPVSIPGHPGAQPNTYLASRLARANQASSSDPTARFPFGHGLSYTKFLWSQPQINDVPVGDQPGEHTFPTHGTVTVGVDVHNVGGHAGTEVVQVYLHHPVASVVRPVVRLVAFAAVRLEANEKATVEFDISADLTAFTGRKGARIVEPGAIELRLSASSEDPRFALPLKLAGQVRTVDHTRVMTAPVRVLRQA